MAVSSASCLTNKIEIAGNSHWLCRREAALRLLHVHCKAGISVRPGPPYTGQAYNRECGGLLSAYGLIKPTTHQPTTENYPDRAKFERNGP